MTNKMAVINFVTQNENGEYKSYINKYNVTYPISKKDGIRDYFNMESGIRFAVEEKMLKAKNVAFQVGEREATLLSEKFIEGWLIEEKEIPDWYDHVINKVKATIVFDEYDYTEDFELEIAYIKDGLYIIFDYENDERGMNLVKGYSKENAIENYFNSCDGLCGDINYIDINIANTIYKCIEG